ncbi:MAG: hypothetical protein JJ913_09015 [Rhizobiaceae bacterium]|nr:hypothetical protein [Rhizobiaceae bacterium]
MAEIVNTAPKFVSMLGAEARPENASVAILLGTAERQKFGLEFDAGVAPAVIAALSGLLGKVASALPADQRPQQQVLQTTGMAFGINEQGQPGIILSLEGGAELMLALTLSDLPALKEMVDQALEAADLDQRH